MRNLIKWFVIGAIMRWAFKWVLMALVMVSVAHASGFNPLEWFLKEKVEDAAKDAVIETVTGKPKGDDKPTKNVPAKSGKDGATETARGDDFLFLPMTGGYRFAMPKDVAAKDLQVGPRGGYVDRFENEWVPVVGRLKNGKRRVLSWQESLSETGKFRLGKAAEWRDQIGVTTDGKLAQR